MSRKRDRENPIDLAARLGLTPSDPASTEAGGGARQGSDAVQESESLRRAQRAQRAYRRRRRLVGVLIAALVLVALAALGVVLWSTGLVGGS